MAKIWDYFWLFRPLGLGDLGLQHQFFCYSNSLWRSYHQHLWVLSKLVLQILEILCCITFFKGADCFNISKAKTSLFWMISPPVCELENFQVQNYTLSSERESHKHTNNTHVTYSVHLRGSYATETIYWWKNLTRVWGNLLERPLTLLPSTSSEQFKNLRVARHKVHIHSLIKKVGCIMCSTFGFRTCFIKKK